MFLLSPCNILGQRLANYSLGAQTSCSMCLQIKFYLRCSHAHSFMYCLWLPWVIMAELCIFYDLQSLKCLLSVRLLGPGLSLWNTSIRWNCPCKSGLATRSSDDEFHSLDDHIGSHLKTCRTIWKWRSLTAVFFFISVDSYCWPSESDMEFIALYIMKGWRREGTGVGNVSEILIINTSTKILR